MQEHFISMWFSPMTLLFLINAFFLFFVTSFVWNIFFHLNHTSSLFKMDKANPLVLKAALFFPLILIAIIAEYKWSLLAHFDFFPLISSSFVRFNFIGIIVSLIALIFVKRLDKEEGEAFKLPIFLITYPIVLYIFYLIILIATVVTRLNVFPDGFPRNNVYLSAERINQFIIAVLFLIHLIFVFFAVSMKVAPRILCLLVYTIALIFIYSLVFR
ncbi:hypothetical protein OQJ13_09995 [Legionella sp. PATHC035]|uniref:hypothetical protein n=1 Tax=Legionella sp. PATHC035 TaxID=2992040 RepID=UPI00224312EA|nr:hypothetical protein [Legionella sp. PATHC035]MCW8409303.1 hypothetical protein [Legionella sp. PATHC035]